MWLGIVSLFPELIREVADAGVLGRAVRNGIVDLKVFNPRDFTSDKHQTVDDRPYGGGAGMVMLVEPLLAAVAAARDQAKRDVGVLPRVVLLSPQAPRLTQAKVQALAETQALVLIAGRYEGVDERFVELAVDEEISIGDYVLSGGELPALVVMDALARLLPGALGNSASAIAESHLDGLLDYPQYTRPENVRGLGVPEILRSGDHRAVQRWRRQQALYQTWQKRPDMLAHRKLDDADMRLLDESIAASVAAEQETDRAKKQNH